MVVYCFLIITFLSQGTRALLAAPSSALPAKSWALTNHHGRVVVGARQSAISSRPSSLGSRSNAPISSPFRNRDGIHHPRRASSYLSLSPTYAASILLSSGVDDDGGAALKSIAEALGYLIGAGSLLLYTPIAVRVLRTKSADGLAASTWWFKLTSFTCTDIYNIRKGFPIAAFSETLVITLEAVIVLGLVTYYQKRANYRTALLACAYVAVTAWALLSPSNEFPRGPPDEWIDLAQALSIVLNTSALLPQLWQNFERRESGDYSPVTASLASVGCAVRLFTTVQLADGDPLLLLNYGTALLLDLALLLQIVIFGTQNEGKSLADLFLADVRSTEDAKLADSNKLA